MTPVMLVPTSEMRPSFPWVVQVIAMDLLGDYFCPLGVTRTDQVGGWSTAHIPDAHTGGSQMLGSPRLVASTGTS